MRVVCDNLTGASARSTDEASLLQLRGCADHVVLCRLEPYPPEELANSILERDRRAVSELRPRRRDVCDAVTDITFPVSADDIRLGLYTKALGKLASDYVDAGTSSGTDVHCLVHRIDCLQRQHVGRGDVGNLNEVSGLLAVLENQGRLSVEKSGRKDCRYPRVWVRERLTRSVDVEISKCHGRNLVSPADNHE